MNSRQRRKIEAKRHNDLLIEEEAYREDMERDHEKYKATLSLRGGGKSFSVAAVAALLALDCIPYRGR